LRPGNGLNNTLLLFSRYLQQLVMESLVKEKDLDGNTVHQGLAVYGTRDRPISMPLCSNCAKASRIFL